MVSTTKRDLIIDFDGTIVCPKQRDYVAYKQLVENFCGTVLEIEEYWALRRSKTNLHEILAASSIESSKHEDWIRRRFALSEDIDLIALDTLLDGVSDFLSNISKTHRLHLLSARRHKERMIEEMKRLGVFEFFSSVNVAKDKGEFLKTRTYVSPIVIGDTEVDILGGKANGFFTVGVLTGIRDFAQLNTLGCDVILQSITDFRPSTHE